MRFDKASCAALAALFSCLGLAAAGCHGTVVDDTGRNLGASQKGLPDSKVDPCWVDLGPNVPGECKIGDMRTCPEGMDAGPEGYCEQKCVNVDGKAAWGATTYSFECAFYDTPLHIDGPSCGCNTPLVLAFEGQHVTFTSEAGAAFDLSRDGVCHASDWPTSATPWLALDRDGDGRIDDGGELFGSATRLANGEFATNGFEALRELDADKNGFFDERDPAFASVVVWRDQNHDRESAPNELVSLRAAGVTSIDLGARREPHCDARGNCEGERSAFAFVDASGRSSIGAVIDVYLPTR